MSIDIRTPVSVRFNKLNPHQRDVVFFAYTPEEYAQLKVYNHEGVRYGCSRCRKLYLQKKTLGRHLRFDCGKSPSFVCQRCQKGFNHRYMLLRHMRYTHDIPIQRLRQRQRPLVDASELGNDDETEMFPPSFVELSFSRQKGGLEEF